MYKISIFFLFLLPILVSFCTRKYENNPVEDFLSPETDQKNQVEIDRYITESEFNKLMKRINGNYDYLNIPTMLWKDTILYNSNEVEVGIIPQKTSVTVLASDIEHPYTYCLVKINNSDEIWAGWIKKTALDSDVQYFLDHYYNWAKEEFGIKDNDTITALFRYYISPDNTMIAWWSNYTDSDEICVFNNKGELLINLKDEDVFPGKDPTWSTGFTLGWSDNSKNVWFHGDDSNSHLYCVYVQPQEKTFRVFESPLQLGMPTALGSIHDNIDFNTGDYYYTDYEDFSPGRYQDEEDFINERKAYLKQTFHVYKHNLFTKETVVVESAYGAGFYVYKENNAVIYKKIEYSW